MKHDSSSGLKLLFRFLPINTRYLLQNDQISYFILFLIKI